jgi:hypothetical protein
VSQRGFHSIEIAASAAQQAVAGGRYAEAERAYRELIGQTHVVDYEYDDWLRGLADAYRHLRRPREAGFVQLYLHGFDAARAAFGALPELRARLCEVEKRWADAAALWIEAGRPVHAAVAWDKAKVYDKARAAWEAVANQPGLRDRPYEQALVQFNIGTAIGKLEPGAAEARKALIEAQRRLEQVADDFEIAGELERAFDCFQIVLKLGKDSGQFENIAEGYVNCIRVLAGDNLKFYVLQYYEDFIRLALERGELHAAATTYQEAAQYAQQVHLPYDRRYQAKSADTWQRCGEKYAEDGLPVEMVENAFLAAIQQYSAVSDYVGVRRMFERLAKLDLSDDKRARYQTVARRYDGASGGGGDAPAFPDYLKQQHAYADIWFADLLEWELAGDPQAVAAAMVGDLRYPNGIRRRALVVLLTTADAEVRDLAAAPETLTALAEQLGELQSYAALAPLEVLYRHPRAGGPAQRDQGAALPVLQAVVRDRAPSPERSRRRGPRGRAPGDHRAPLPPRAGPAGADLSRGHRAAGPRRDHRRDGQDPDGRGRRGLDRRPAPGDRGPARRRALGPGGARQPGHRPDLARALRGRERSRDPRHPGRRPAPAVSPAGCESRRL